MTEPKTEIILSPLVTNGVPKFVSFICHRFFERALWAFTELGIADQMADHKLPLTAAELSQLNGNDWNIEFTYRLLRTVSDADIVKQIRINDNDSNIKANTEYEDRFQLTDNGLFLTTNHPSKARDMIRVHLGPIMQNSSTYLPNLIRNGYKYGNGFEQAVGSSLFDYLHKKENKEYSNMFNNAMSASSHYAASSVASVIDFSRFEKLVDIGGGCGTLLSYILEKYQKLNGIVFELDHVIENAKMMNPNDFQKKQIESNRYQFVSGDMFKPETIPVADSYILKFVIHDWNDQKAVQLLKSICLANKHSERKSITIFIVEMILLSNDISNWEVRATDMEMMLVTSAKERTKDEYIQLLNRSGFEFKQLYQTDGFFSIIEAINTNSFSN